MNLKIQILSDSTVFTFEGKQYKRGSTVWNSSVQKEYNGVQGDDITLRSCHPKLGGVFQENVKVWFSEETIVQVD